MILAMLALVEGGDFLRVEGTPLIRKRVLDAFRAADLRRKEQTHAP